MSADDEILSHRLVIEMASAFRDTSRGTGGVDVGVDPDANADMVALCVVVGVRNAV